MSEPFLIFEDYPPKYKLYIEETKDGYHISFKDCISDVWDLDICDYLNLNVKEYQTKLKLCNGYTFDGRMTFFKKKKDLQSILEWLESLQMVKKLAGED